MKAIQVTKYVSGPQDLFVSELPTPTPDPSRYLIKIHACGINFYDLLQIQGKYQHQPPLPWISGMEFAGTILATPTSPPSSKKNGSQTAASLDGTLALNTSHKFKVGDRVFGGQQGAYATHILAPEESMFLIPEGWSYTDAAGVFVTMPTAFAALATRAKTQPGEWVLVHAGAGGVGLSAVQVAKGLGAKVIATAGTERKRQVCLDYGADFVVDYGDKTWPQKVIGICEQHRTGNGKAGVDVVYDPVGMIEASLKCIAWNGRLLVIGFAGGSIEKVAMNRVLLKNCSIVGLHWGAYKLKEPETEPGLWNDILDFIKQGKIKPIIFTDKSFDGLENLPKALAALGGRETWGKVAVTLGDHEGEDGRSKL